MDYWLINSLCAFLLCVLFTGILIPQILLVAFRRNLFDEPDPRKIHKGAVPRLGGIAFTPVVCFSIGMVNFVKKHRRSCGRGEWGGNL